jgi:hypothetical protein
MTLRLRDFGLPMGYSVEVQIVSARFAVTFMAEKGGSRTLRGPYGSQTGFEDQRHHRAPSFSGDFVTLADFYCLAKSTLRRPVRPGRKASFGGRPQFPPVPRMRYASGKSFLGTGYIRNRLRIFGKNFQMAWSC